MGLRPQRFDEIIGQDDAVSRLRIITQSAISRGAVAPHALFEGPPGLGKTTMARAMANELGKNITIANAASVGTLKKMLPYVMKMQEGDVLFVDEIHRLPKPIQEFLFPVIEDFRVDLSNGEHTESIDIPQFTFIGATTEGGGLLAPLRDRFKQKVKLDLYAPADLMEMGRLNAPKIKVSVTDDAMLHLAKMSRGTPRIMNARLEWVRDYCLAHNLSQAGKDTVVDALSMIGIDQNGLTEQDRKYLTVLAETIKNTGNAVGLKTLVASTNLSEDDIAQVIEPFLLREGMILRTAKGRTLGKWKR